MKKYMCCECHEISTEKEWNDATENAYDPEPVAPISEGCDCDFICPKCGQLVYFANPDSVIPWNQEEGVSRETRKNE